MTKLTESKQIIIYQSKDGKISFNVNIFEETVWLTQKQMAELFDRNRVAITQHINNIFKEGELDKDSVCKDFLHTASDGKVYNTKYYNLDVVISVGYRVKSQRGTQFRIWATNILKHYMVSGYVFNEDRIKAIEDNFDKLSEEFRSEIKEIKQTMIRIANRPITINNRIHIGNNKLEEKIVELIDEILSHLKTDKIRSQLEEVKGAIKTFPKDEKGKARIKNFFNRLGDKDSDLYKTVQGAGIAKKIITELIKLGEKLKDMIF